MEKVKIRPFTDFVKTKFRNQKLLGAEVGVRRGNNAARLLDEILFEQLYLIDLWGKFKQVILWKDVGFTDENLEWLYPAVVKRFENRPNVTIHRLPSLEASKKFPNEYFHFVYIDACHSYEHVMEDILVWLPKIKAGGVLGGHDYRDDKICPGVNRAVDEFIQNSGYELHQDCPDWWIEKGN